MSFNLNFFHILLFYVSYFSIGEFPFDFDPSVIDNGGNSQLSDDHMNINNSSIPEYTDPSEESDYAENNREINPESFNAENSVRRSGRTRRSNVFFRDFSMYSKCCDSLTFYFL